MKKIVIIGANNFQMPLIIKAKELGYETHVFAWAEGAVGAAFADYFYPISIVEKDGDRLYEEVGVVSIQMELQSKMLGDKEWHGCGCSVLEKL